MLTYLDPSAGGFIIDAKLFSYSVYRPASRNDVIGSFSSVLISIFA